jgi:DNA processing protein
VDEQTKLAMWHQVSSAKGIGPVRFRDLWTFLGDRISGVFEMTDAELMETPGVNRQVLSGIRAQTNRVEESVRFAEEQLELVANCGGTILMLDDPRYPRMLRESKMCHPIVYCRGDVDVFTDFEKSIGIVGTRQAANESLRLTTCCAHDLAEQGWVIVSGLALGIDSAAHEGALDAKGKTIAVMGCGPDVIYPKEEIRLYDDIVGTGLVISEYPFGMRVNPLNLKKRNKTTVALSAALFPVETGASGGARNAIDACEEQDKPVFTIVPPWECYVSGNVYAAEKGALLVGSEFRYRGEPSPKLADFPFTDVIARCIQKNLEKAALSPT